MKNKIALAVLLAAVLAPAVLADEIRADAPQHYTVVKGDTLWDIAARFLRDPWAWPAVWQANPAIHNPHLIYPGNVILLCSIDTGGKVLAVDGGDGCAGVLRALQATPATLAQDDATIRLEPQIQDLDNSTVIPTIPLRVILPYLNEGRVVSSEALRDAPYVLAGADQRLLSGTGDEVFLRGHASASESGYALYHPGGVYVDPDTGERLGVQASFVGRVELGAKEADVTRARILNMKEVVRDDDRLLALPQQVVTAVFAPASSQGVKAGRVLRVLGGVDHGGKYSVIVINRGERDGVHQGHVFSLYRHGSIVEDSHDKQLLRLPREYEGLAMAFRTFPTVSYLLILKAHRPIVVGDDTAAPQAGDD